MSRLLLLHLFAACWTNGLLHGHGVVAPQVAGRQAGSRRRQAGVWKRRLLLSSACAIRSTALFRSLNRDLFISSTADLHFSSPGRSDRLLYFLIFCSSAETWFLLVRTGNHGREDLYLDRLCWCWSANPGRWSGTRGAAPAGVGDRYSELASATWNHRHAAPSAIVDDDSRADVDWHLRHRVRASGLGSLHVFSDAMPRPTLKRPATDGVRIISKFIDRDRVSSGA